VRREHEDELVHGYFDELRAAGVTGFTYEELWGERTMGPVANLTRLDGEEFLRLAPQVPVHTEVEVFPLDAADEALDAIRSGRLRGAAVLQVA
jgi:propanol-preferring alcohol dehydrogenase